MIRGAIFDADGTLLDSMSIWDTIGEDYLRSIGYIPKEDLSETFKTFSLYQAACYYQKEYGVPFSTAQIMDDINKMISFFYREQVQLKQGVEAFLSDLQNKDVVMCIATATDSSLIDVALKRCGIRNYFSKIFTCKSVGYSKCEPIIYREAMKHLETLKTETVVFEDALHAAQTAKNDGFSVIGVYDCSENQQTELQETVDFYLEDFLNFDSFWKYISK
ncbi:HAD family hydrolase [Faecalimonas sp.]